MCNDFLASIPRPDVEQMNEEDCFKKYPTDYDECLNTVIVQEVGRFNNVLRIIHSSCKELVRALAGLVVMSGEMQAAARSIENNQVPTMWENVAYPSLKPLAGWVADLNERMAFVTGWIDNGAPSAFWLSGFFFPQAFLTGARQNYARKMKLAVDTIDYGYEIIPKMGPEMLAGPPPADGVYVYGFFIEGAVWDYDKKCITDPNPRELFSEMPTFLFRPEQNRPDSHDAGIARDFMKSDAGAIYMCPLYKVLTRAGTLLTTGHSTNFVQFIEVPTAKDQVDWVRAGVAMFLALRS
jgi:dynein heavy chain